MKPREYTVTISHVNDRGYGVAVLEDDQELLVLNTLPNEQVIAESFKRKGGCVFARAIKIITPSPHRVAPREEHFLASSPWQIMDFNFENQVKSNMIAEFFAEEGIELQPPEVVHDNKEFGYRNKVEFGFYSYDETEFLEFAYFKREGSKGKYPLTQCQLMPQAVNEVATCILKILQETDVTAKQLKSLLLRYSFSTQSVIASLFVKDPLWQFPAHKIPLIMQNNCVGFQVCFSDPRSPASIITQTQHSVGANSLTEEICGLNLTYPMHGFFQVNPPLFSKCMNDIKKIVWKLNQQNNLEVLDLYAGVGTIGLCLYKPGMNIKAVELFEGSKDAAKHNAAQNKILDGYQFVEASAEKSLQEIQPNQIVIVDPPRVGLHPDVIERLLEVQPPLIVYVSCNPKTQAQNIALLSQKYTITFSKAYNFYPKTPHCEHVVVLEKI